jgi:curved DNA-binding protein CbpA
MPRNYTAQENKLFRQAKAMFGLNEKYTKIEVRKKYIELSREFHPDKFHAKGKDIEKKEDYDKKLNEHTLMFQAVSKAQEILLERLQNPIMVQRPMNTSNIFSNIEKLNENNFVRSSRPSSPRATSRASPRAAPRPTPRPSPRAKAGGGSPKGSPKGSKLGLSPRAAAAAKQKLYSSKKNKDALRLLGFTEEEIEDRNHAGMSTINSTKILNKFIQNRTMTKEVEDAFKHLYKNGPASKPEESQSNPVVQREIIGHINYRRGKFGGVKIENL